MQFKQPGPWLFAVGMTKLGVVGVLGEPEDWLFAWSLCLILAGPCLLFQRTRAVAGGVLALCMLAQLGGTIPYFVEHPGNFNAWVGTAQLLTFAAVATAFIRLELWSVARIVLRLAVAVFGGVHLLHPTVISSLLPDWFPVPGVWPYLTGAVQIAAGLAILIGFRAQVVTFAVGLMWLSWIPLVHLSRLLDPEDGLFEWTLMLTALALAGAAWSVGERIPAKAGGDLPSRTH